MPIKRYKSGEPSFQALLKETSLPGELTMEDYQASFSPHEGIIVGHTPSVQLSLLGKGRRLQDVFHGTARSASYLHAMENRIEKFFVRRAQATRKEDRCAPYFISSGHSGIWVFFARRKDQDAFLSYMEGRFEEIPGAELKNLKVARARLLSGFKPKCPALYQAYRHLAFGMAKGHDERTQLMAMAAFVGLKDIARNLQGESKAVMFDITASGGMPMPSTIAAYPS